MGGRTYPVRYYPVAIWLRDRKGRAILCSHYFLSVGTLRVLHSECVPSHSFTQYLASVEQYQQRVKEYATQRRYSDLMNVPKNVDAHLRRVNMNHQLDQTLLELYPNFGEAFNNLLRPEERFQLKKNELMNTPMRIFALIRLGIAHHDTIAEILNCSINTVYTYKTKTILRSDLSADEFYEALMQISAFH